MTYLPVTPGTNLVHFFTSPHVASDTRTVCGASGEWVKSVAAIDGSEPICPTCYPESVPATLPKREEATMTPRPQTGGTMPTTYAELAATMPTRELIRQSGTHKITCVCDRCTAFYAELVKRGGGTAADYK